MILTVERLGAWNRAEPVIPRAESRVLTGHLRTVGHLRTAGHLQTLEQRPLLVEAALLAVVRKAPAARYLAVQARSEELRPAEKRVRLGQPRAECLPPVARLQQVVPLAVGPLQRVEL